MLARLLRASRAAVPAVPASVSYRATYSNTNDQSSYTFAASDIGTATDRSLVVVAIHYGSSSISSVTIGGVSATQVVAVGAGLNTAIYRAVVASGSTADIVVTMSGTALRCLVSVYALYSLTSTTPVDSSTTVAISGGSSLSRTIDTRTDGVIIGAASANVGGVTFTWTGSTERYDTSLESAHSYSGAGGSTTSNTTTTVSFTTTGSSGLTYAIASWR